MKKDQDMGAKIEATMARVEAMEPGGNLEALLEEESRDLKKALFQEADSPPSGRRQTGGFFPLRSARIARRRPCVRSGTKKRTARTLGGELHYVRTVYECPQCRRCHAPLDEELAVESGERLSRGVKQKVMYAAARESFGEAARTLQTLADLKVSKAECERTALEEGARRDAEQRAEEAVWLAPVAVGDPVPQPEDQSRAPGDSGRCGHGPHCQGRGTQKRVLRRGVRCAGPTASTKGAGRLWHESVTPQAG